MTPALARGDVERFRALVAHRLGLQFDEGKTDFLTDVLRERLAESKADAADSYLTRLETPNGQKELSSVAEQLTVAETYFFRNPDHFRAFVELVLPDRMRAQNATRHLRILSAGCASGDEAYSLAILLREHVPDLSTWRVSIHGIDIKTSMIERANQGRYSAWSLRQTPTDVRERYFRAVGRDFMLSDPIRQMASFEERNLVEDDRAFWRKDAFDVVFCRNVTMYFSIDTSRAIVSRMARSLTVGGYLFLGHAETLRGVSNEFHLRHTHETFYYQRRETTETDVAPVWMPSNGTPHLGIEMPPVAPEADGSWVDAIKRASDRIAHLARDSRDATHATALRASGASPDSLGSVGSAASPGLRGSWDTGIALELLREERFADALKVLTALPQESQVDSDAQLLRAVLLTNSGALEAAEATCRDILSRDELSVGAHYLTALSREHIGDLDAALEHDQAAAYLDPGFAMPRLHMGLLARRAGDRQRAEAELGRALVLLAREDASRILLFGGGFTREALMSLCRAELLASGGRP